MRRFLAQSKGPEGRVPKIVQVLVASLTTVKRGLRLCRELCVEVVKGKKCVGEVIVGFPSSGFCTIFEALPSDEVEDPTSDMLIGLAVDYG